MVSFQFFQSRGIPAPQPSQTDLLRLQTILEQGRRPGVGQLLAESLTQFGTSYLQGKQAEAEMRMAEQAAEQEAQWKERALATQEGQLALERQRWESEQSQREYELGVRPQEYTTFGAVPDVEATMRGIREGLPSPAEAAGLPREFGRTRKERMGARISEALRFPEISGPDYQVERYPVGGRTAPLTVAGQTLDFGPIAAGPRPGTVVVPTETREAQETARELETFRTKTQIEQSLKAQFDREGIIDPNQRALRIEGVLERELDARTAVFNQVMENKQRLLEGKGGILATRVARMTDEQITTKALEDALIAPMLSQYMRQANGDILRAWNLFVEDTNSLRARGARSIGQAMGMSPESLGVQENTATEQPILSDSQTQSMVNALRARNLSVGGVIDHLEGRSEFGTKYNQADIDNIMRLYRQSPSR